MAKDEHVAQLNKGVAAWNDWRGQNPDIRPDLRGADISQADLSEADLADANLSQAILLKANLREANLSEADLLRADLSGADLSWANLSNADLSQALLFRTNLREANLSNADLGLANLFDANLVRANLARANLTGAELRGADLRGADLRGTDLSEADLLGANLIRAKLFSANLVGADLTGAQLANADLTGADLTGCRIYGASAWGLKLKGVKQGNLVITPYNEPEITVDNIEVAQLIYLLLHNEKIRDVFDTITSKVVLILGRFTHQRKAVLDALREELRKRDYLPILIDFDLPEGRNVTETVTLLARMARFIIADLTDPSSIPQELQAIIPSVHVPVQLLLLEGSSLYSMFEDFDPQDFHWVLPVYKYKEPKQLLATLAENVIAPAEGKVKALEERRRMIEAQLRTQ